MTGRRRFIATASGLVAAGAAAVVGAPRVIAQPKIQWRMSTAWPPQLDNLQRSAEQVGQLVSEMSGGRFQIQVYAGGQIMAPFACFDAASKGEIEAFMAAGTYWVDRDVATAWFSAIPFGMDPQGMAAWYQHGDGLKLWEETFAPFNLIPRMGPAFAPQMGGWFRKKINTVGDYKGLKMRIAGLGGQVIAKAGATAVLTPAAEIYPTLERGVIDAAEFVGPYLDRQLGLQRAAKYYYTTGWHETATASELIVNKAKWASLPPDLKAIVENACAACNVSGEAWCQKNNAEAMEDLIKNQGVIAQPLPDAIVAALRTANEKILAEAVAKDPVTKKVHDSYMSYMAKYKQWAGYSEAVYHDKILGKG
jgi:TRAP-type mannitol/chloroaromatic compound transport system substrate-binding protein